MLGFIHFGQFLWKIGDFPSKSSGHTAGLAYSRFIVRDVVIGSVVVGVTFLATSHLPSAPEGLEMTPPGAN